MKLRLVEFTEFSFWMGTRVIKGLRFQNKFSSLCISIHNSAYLCSTIGVWLNYCILLMRACVTLALNRLQGMGSRCSKVHSHCNLCHHFFYFIHMNLKKIENTATLCESNQIQITSFKRNCKEFDLTRN